MNSNRVPWVLLVIAAVFGGLLQIPRSGGSAQNPRESGQTSVPRSEEKATTTSERTENQTEQKDQADDRWKEAAEVIRGFFGNQAATGNATPTAFAMDEVAGLAERAQGYSLESLIVLAPDPVESGLATGFDEALAAVQEAYADDGYILDRFWLPWTGEAQERRDYQTIPGILLYRHFDEAKKKLAAVLVVGEVPRQGVHPAAFLKALRLIEGWDRHAGAESMHEVRVVGPYFSDSAGSLRRNLDRLLTLPSQLQVRLVSGSAMAHRLTGVFNLPNVAFGQSIVNEQELQKRAVAFFAELGWDTTRVALLAQADTAFEQPFLTDENKDHFILIRFPTGISGIRTAWENDLGSSSQQDGSEGTLEVPKTTLDITLGDRGQPVHRLPETGTFTSASRDLEISNLLAVIGSRQIDYIGIVATDPRDTLFLAERIRRLAPSKILFIVNNHLLFTHPSWAPLMNGTLVLSGYPLFAEGPRWKDELGGPKQGKYLRQFTSSVHQGIYRAVTSLRSSAVLPQGNQQLAWMSVIGNSSLWPIACLATTDLAPADRKKLAACVSPTNPEPGPSSTGRTIGDELSYRTNTKLIWFFLALCLLAGALIRLGEVPRGARGESRLPRLVAPCVLWLMGGVLAALGALPYYHLEVPPVWHRDWRLLVAGGLMILLFALLARYVAGEEGSWGKAFVAFLIGGFVLFFLIDYALASLWMPGGAESFHQRVFVLSSGLSPLVSLAWLGGSLYLWSLAELRRYRMALRQKLHRPHPIGFPDAEGMGEAFDRLESIVKCSLPRPLQFHWLILAPVVALSVSLLLPLHPLREIDLFGRILLALLGLLLARAILFLCRSLWPRKFHWKVLMPVAVSLMLFLLFPQHVADTFLYGELFSSLLVALLAVTLFLAILFFGRFLFLCFRKETCPWVILIPAALSSVFILLPLRPVAETGLYGRLFSMLLGLTLFLGAVSFCRFLWTWMVLQRILKALGLPHPPQGLDSDLAQAVSWKPMKSFGWQIPSFGRPMIQAIDCLEELAKTGTLVNTGIWPEYIRDTLEEAMTAARKDDLKLELARRNEADSLLRDANRTLALREVNPLTRRFYALRLTSYIRYMFAHLRAFLIATLACGFPLLAAASTYAYEPNEYVTNSIWSLLLIAVLLTLAVFFQMDRNEILSKIAGTNPGEVTLNLDLVLGTVTYGVVPLLGLVIAQFPNVGRYFVTLLNPLVRALGAS